MDSVLNDKTLLFHSVGNNIFGFIGVMKYGICSNSKSKELNNPYFCINTVGSNGYNYICTSMSPSINGINISDTYNGYIKNGIGFIIRLDNNLEIKENNGSTSYNDICYIKNYIPLDNIVGIIINKEMMDKSLSEVTLGINKKNLTYSSVVPKKCLHLAKCMEEECGYKIDMNYLNHLISEHNYDSIERFICLNMDNAFKYKFNNQDIKMRDIIDYYNDGKYKIYDEHGIETLSQNVTKK